MGSYYANPYPLSEQHYLVAWSDRHLPPHCRVDDTNQNPVNATGLYLLDAFGNLNLIYRDPAISSECPIPVRARPVPPVHADAVAWDGPQEGRFYLQRRLRGPAGRAAGHDRSVADRGRAAEGPAADEQPHAWASRPKTRASSCWARCRSKLTARPRFRVPSGIPVFFQALDRQGLAVQTMRSLTYVQPGQTLSCIGCHESREAAPPVRAVSTALRHEPSKITPGPPARGR